MSIKLSWIKNNSQEPKNTGLICDIENTFDTEDNFFWESVLWLFFIPELHLKMLHDVVIGMLYLHSHAFVTLFLYNCLSLKTALFVIHFHSGKCIASGAHYHGFNLNTVESQGGAHSVYACLHLYFISLYICTPIFNCKVIFSSIAYF